MAQYHSIVKCGECLSNNHFYNEYIYIKINLIQQKRIFDCPDVVKCQYCLEYLEFTKKYIVMNENKNKTTQKMKLNEPNLESKYVKSEDIGTGNGADGVLTCKGEGDIVQGRYGDRLELPVNVGGLDKIWSVSPMNQKLLMGMLGDDTTLWVDKEIEVFLSPSATAKSGFYIGVKE